MSGYTTVQWVSGIGTKSYLYCVHVGGDAVTKEWSWSNVSWGWWGHLAHAWSRLPMISMYSMNVATQLASLPTWAGLSPRNWTELLDDSLEDPLEVGIPLSAMVFKLWFDNWFGMVWFEDKLYSLLYAYNGPTFIFLYLVNSIITLNLGLR